MLTIKKSHKNSFNNEKFIRQFSSVVRYCYNRIKKDNITKKSDLEWLVKDNMNNIDLLDASWIQEAVKKATELNQDTKLYFGSKKEFFKRKYHKTNNYDDSKLIPLDMRGSSSHKGGNRKAKLDIINNKLIFKPNKNQHYEIDLNLSKNERNMLLKLEQQCQNKENYFNIKIDLNNVWISFDETRLPKDEVYSFINDRVLGIDLNPNYIALSIVDYKNNKSNIIHKELICLNKLMESPNTNKRNYELIKVCEKIVDLTKQYKCELISLEDLNIKSKDNNKGKGYNRLVNNKWNRNLVVNNLSKRCNLLGIKLIKVKPHYSSFIGQMKYEKEFDSIAASLEVGYRGYLRNNGRNEYDSINDLCYSYLPTRWKKMVNNASMTFKELYYLFKQNKMIDCYRFNFKYQEYGIESFFSLGSVRSMVEMYRF